MGKPIEMLRLAGVVAVSAVGPDAHVDLELMQLGRHAEASPVKAAIFLQLGGCGADGAWPAMSECVGNVARAAEEGGHSLAVHVDIGRACEEHSPRIRDIVEASFPEGLAALIRTVPDEATSTELLAGQLERAWAAGASHDLALALGDAADNHTTHLAVQSLCGTVPQVHSVMHQFDQRPRLRLLSPLGTMMHRGTSASDVLPSLHLRRCAGEAACGAALSAGRLSLLRRGAPAAESTLAEVGAGADPVAVAGGAFWARFGALPRSLPEISRGLRQDSELSPSDAKDAQLAALEVLVPTAVLRGGGMLAEMPPAPKPMALYFPQYHPIPENDRFWGENFTEWTLLRPFEGPQIRKPLDVQSGGLGFYDLRDVETRKKQGELARKHGVHGFVYYHYWFSSVPGHKVMHQVPELMLQDGEPSLPFMLSWANEAWTRHWDGASSRHGKGRSDRESGSTTGSTVLLAQSYGQEAEWQEHFEYLLQFFRHPKYIRVGGRPAFAIYRPGLLKEKLEPMLTLWKQLAVDSGLPGLHIISTVTSFYNQGDELRWQGTPTVDSAFHFLSNMHFRAGAEPPAPPGKRPASTSDDDPELLQRVQYWGAYAGFDNRPRRGEGSELYERLTLSPSDFRDALSYSLAGMARKPARHIWDNLYFLASWNEWNEQSVLEPDDAYRLGFLEALQEQLRSVPIREFASPRL